MNLTTVIQSAKLGRARKDAQEDTCTVFAAALYDVLVAQGVPCQMVVAESRYPLWAHSLVEVNGQYYDSMGEFSNEIYRSRAKIHPTVDTTIAYNSDTRSECFEPEFDELYAFYVKALNKSLCRAD